MMWSVFDMIKKKKYWTKKEKLNGYIKTIF